MNLLDAKRARFLARVGGVLYLIIIVLGALGEAVVRGSIVVSGNATATAANLRSMEWLWRLGVAGEVVLLTCATALALILYILLRRVSRDLALAAVSFYLVSIAIEGVAAVSLAAALFPLGSAQYLKRSRRSRSTPWRCCRSGRTPPDSASRSSSSGSSA